MIKKLFLFALLQGSLFFQGYAQDLVKMSAWQDSLLKLSTLSLQRSSDAERIENNYKFVKALVSSLKETNAFLFDFEKLNTISILNAPDGSFRIFSWYLPLLDGSFLYYGAIQYRSENLKITPLLDKTFEIKDPSAAILQANSWYGARYYDIVPISSGQYILLGWKGHHADYSQKLIEVLNILPTGTVTFGAKIFSDNPDFARRIFSYTRQVAMYLQYNKEKAQIEYDHIVPTDPRMKDDYKFYGPDLTYDAYRIQNKGLKFLENIELKNNPNKNDNKYLDPIRPNSRKSGFK